MTRPTPQNRPRAGFTLVELLIVIVIIGILVALIVPAIMGAVRVANNARVTAEINNFAAALEQFKSKYGDYPPSRVILYEGGGYNTTSSAAPPSRTKTDITLGQLSQRSLQYLRKFFPKAVPPTASHWHDFNGNGTADSGALYLEGHECFVFFLGGIPNHTGKTIGTTGFGRNPLFPFTNQIIGGGAMASDARTKPLYEFRANRLIDSDGDGIPGYVDPLNAGSSNAQYYAYFSAYGNNMYDPNDMNLASDGELGSSSAEYFNVKIGVSGNSVSSPSPNPYCTDPPASGSQFPNFINPTSFQIISAGYDSTFGPGGQYSPNSNEAALPTSGKAGTNARLYEQDNLSNFATGRLE